MIKVTYSPRSYYSRTPISGRFLSYSIDRPIPADAADGMFQITRERYVHAPDNLAYDLYGSEEYWWVFGRRNNLQDWVFDIEMGITLIVPDAAYLKRLLG